MRRLSRRLAGLVFLFAALASAFAFAQPTAVEVIPLRYRTADQVIPVIEPLLGRDGSVSGFQGQLIVRARPENVAEIRRVLEQIDKAPRRLMVTVRQETDAERRRREAEVSGSIGNDNVRVTVPGSGTRHERAVPPGGSVTIQDGDDRLRGRVIDSRSVESDRNAQTVQVLEGNSAFIYVGQSVPVQGREVRRTVVGGQTVDQVVDTVEYRDVKTGFYVRPRLSGDTVTVEINPRQESLDRSRRGAVSVQQVVTTVSGRLGEWIEIGGVDVDRTGSQSVLLGRSSRGEMENRRVVIKVDELR
jgi:hypothetical protein